jgi:hypothetical protein
MITNSYQTEMECFLEAIAYCRSIALYMYLSSADLHLLEWYATVLVVGLLLRFVKRFRHQTIQNLHMYLIIDVTVFALPNGNMMFLGASRSIYRFSMFSAHSKGTLAHAAIL